jgi:hypothetical protein
VTPPALIGDTMATETSRIDGEAIMAIVGKRAKFTPELS